MGLADRDYMRDERLRNSNRRYSSNQAPPKKDESSWKILLAFIIGLAVGVVFADFRSGTLMGGTSVPLPKIPLLDSAMGDSLPKQPLPENGSYKLFYPADNYVASFTVTADPINHYVVKLIDQTNNPVLYLFVRANSEATVKAPLGNYELRWVRGKQWYGYDHLFGGSSEYKKALRSIDFREEQTNAGKRILGHYVRFNTITQGNLPSTGISPRNF